ncbi:DUF2183 domain-containing protein [Candidatus Pacebacteria bacterium]|nr:DUF2183 domain-containing protein [Candidatus Paceibacterota bacterium]
MSAVKSVIKLIVKIILKPLKILFGITSDPVIKPLRGFGSQEKVVVLGRVTENAPETIVDRRFSGVRNALATFRDYLADPIPEQSVTVTFAGTAVTVVTNESGIFEAQFTPAAAIETNQAEWSTAEAYLTEPEEKTSVILEVLVEGKSNTYGIISDIDDTVLVSNATKKLKLIYMTMFKTAEKRSAFLGVAALYAAFREGEKGESTNPVFYVSSSHWNLFETLTAFFDINNLVKGPLLLKDNPGITRLLDGVGDHDHKRVKIEKVLAAYPSLPFVLSGDSGQHDAAIYADIAKRYPGRIKAIYIRDITVQEDQLVSKAQETLGKIVPLVVAKNSLLMADHAEKNGLITAEASANVRAVEDSNSV